MFVKKAGLEKLLFGEHKDEKDRVLSTKATWSDLWINFYKKARQWNQKKLFEVFGDSEPVEPGLSKHFPENQTDRHRLLYGEFIRENHERLAFDITYFGFPGSVNSDLFRDCKENNCDRNTKDMIGIVARSHRIDLRNRDLEEYIKRHHFKPNEYGIPIYYLMAVLHIADSLHIGKNRAHQEMRDNNTFESPISNKEFDLNQAVPYGSKFIKDQKHVTIDLSQDVNSSSVYIHFEEVLGKMQNELNICWAVLVEHHRYDYELSVHRIKSNIFDNNITTFSEKFITKKAELKVNPDIMHLLVKPLYGKNPSFGVRELLQNAVDACNERDVLEKDASNPYEGKITVIVDTKSANPTLTITDNGTGMDENVLLNYYLTVGASFRDSYTWRDKIVEEESNMPRIARNGRFGIGMLAGFLLGDKITVVTRHMDNDKGYCFSFAVGSRDLNVEKIDVGELGTSIKITLHDEAIKFFNDTKREKGISYLYTGGRPIPAVPSWYNWYCFTKPVIHYILNGAKIEFDEPNFFLGYEIDIHDGWNIFYSEIHPDVEIMWKIKNDNFFYYNGFFVRMFHSPTYKSANKDNINYGLDIPMPTISLSDRNKAIDLNVTKTNIDNFNLEINFIKIIYHQFLAELLNVKNYDVRHETKWGVHYLAKSRKGFTVCARTFLLNCKKTILLRFQRGLKFGSKNIDCLLTQPR